MTSSSFFRDVLNGLRCRCPRCGEGKLFSGFLKTRDQCACCGEEFHHHKADDFPAYIVIMIVGHIMVPFALGLEDFFAPPFWVHVAATLPLTFVLCVALLQPVKGAVIAIQWRYGMHGFKDAFEKRNPAG